MKVIDLGHLDYDGTQLHHAFAYEQVKESGTTICYFKGRADVSDHLVDLEDSLSNDFIKSDEMWHFIIEIPEASITETVIWQRLFIFMCISNIAHYYGQSVVIKRNGDDIMVDDRKLSVSIATLSLFSGLIHVGINTIVGDVCPVDAIGLTEFTSDIYHNEFGEVMAQIFSKEYKNIKNATYKVIGVH